MATLGYGSFNTPRNAPLGRALAPVQNNNTNQVSSTQGSSNGVKADDGAGSSGGGSGNQWQEQDLTNFPSWNGYDTLNRAPFLRYDETPSPYEFYEGKSTNVFQRPTNVYRGADTNINQTLPSFMSQAQGFLDPSRMPTPPVKYGASLLAF